jgi:hypothetical protein
MKKKAFKVPVLVILVILVLFSCKTAKQNDNAAADIYVKSIIFDGEPVYGLAQYVIGYAVMNTVTVTAPGGAIDQLTAYDVSKMIYYSEPSIAMNTYSTTPPTPGTYSYGITFDDGIQKVVTDNLGTSYLLPATITSISKSTNSQSVILNWEPLLGVDYFQLSISKAGTVVYTSDPFVPPTGNTLTIPIGLITSFTPGTYTYQLDAIKYASLQTGNIQAISSASTTIDL